MVEERQLRYLGHAWRYGEERWAKFLLQAERPGQKKTGKLAQYRKQVPKLLENKNLDTDAMEDKILWSCKLRELYPRSNTRPGNDNRDNGRGPKAKDIQGNPKQKANLSNSFITNVGKIIRAVPVRLNHNII